MCVSASVRVYVCVCVRVKWFNLEAPFLRFPLNREKLTPEIVNRGTSRAIVALPSSLEAESQQNSLV